MEYDGPKLEAQRKGLAQLFSDHQHLEARLIAVRQVAVNGDRARVRATIEIRDAASSTPEPALGLGMQQRTLRLVNEAGRWTIRSVQSIADEAAAAIEAAPSEESRRTVVAAEGEFPRHTIFEPIQDTSAFATCP